MSLDYVVWGLIEYRRETKGGGDDGHEDGDGGGDSDSDSDSDNDSEFCDPSECQVNLLVALISDNKINGDSRDVILSTGSVIPGVYESMTALLC